MKYIKIGICTKCKTSGNVIMHHPYGYADEHKDEVYPYCRSCHAKIHIEARKSGKCVIPAAKLNRLSQNSCNRRSHKEHRRHIQFTETLMPNVRLHEFIFIWSDSVDYSARFQAHHGKELYYINI